MYKTSKLQRHAVRNHVYIDLLYPFTLWDGFLVIGDPLTGVSRWGGPRTGGPTGPGPCVLGWEIRSLPHLLLLVCGRSTLCSCLMSFANAHPINWHQQLLQTPRFRVRVKSARRFQAYLNTTVRLLQVTQFTATKSTSDLHHF